MTTISPVRGGTALLASGVLLAAGALLAGCAAGGPRPGAAASSSTVNSSTGNSSTGNSSTGNSSTPDAGTAAIVACYRAHGDPSFPDPVYDPGDGEWHFAVSPGTAPASTRQACQHLFPSGNASPPVPQARFQALVRLAECLRQHGVPNWPDPDPDGSYPLPPALQTKTPAYVRAAQDCQRLWPSGGIDAHAAG
jgi:hypothetical protein